MSTIEIKVIPTANMFFSEENNFGIYRCNIDKDGADKIEEMGWDLSDYDNISFKGISPRLNNGEEYIATIKEDDKSQYKGSYILESIRQEKPVTIEEQRIFLESILTEYQVNNIFKVYSNGEDIVEMIESGSFAYQSVKGLGDKSYEKLKTKVLDNLEMSEVLVFLSKYGIKYNMISKLVKEYGNGQIVIEKIEANPYLLTEVKGIGFDKADQIAKSVGYSMTSQHRIGSCIKHIIQSENNNGHCWVDTRMLMNKCIDYLNIDKSYIQDVMKNGVKDVLNKDGRYTLELIYEAERNIAEKMIQIKTQSKKLFETKELDEFLDAYCDTHNVELDKMQRQFFYDWNENNVKLLIGSGGMGKSWLQKILIELISTKNLRIALLAPTGRASKVMTGFSGMLASTIHRKIGVYDSDEEAGGSIQEDIVVVDESSMCDVLIISKLFSAIVNNGVRILFVGDDFQLPSVGVGNFLYDVINSGVIDVTELEKVFRQEEDGIYEVATNIRNGVRFLNNSDEGRIRFGKDCLFNLIEKKFVKDSYMHSYKKVLERYDVEDVVILTPTNKGKLGTVEINKEIQKIVNPESESKKEKTFGKDAEITYRVGDMVMNVVNSYDVDVYNADVTTDENDKVEGSKADVFNGDTGRIVDIDESSKSIVIDFDGVVVGIKFETVYATLIHSWAITKHKSQGGQYKVVIAIIDNSSKYQLNANLMYTGVSRAKEYLLVIGQAEAINYAIKKFANMERRSFLGELLLEYNGDKVS